MLNAIVDLSHHNGTPDFVKAKAAGILGVIHKATQGTSYWDSMYAANRGKALAAGLLFGAYHFGEHGDGAAQADYFLSRADPHLDTLMALDLETNPTGASMTLSQAEAFVDRVHEKTGEYPLLYGGAYLKKLLNGQANATLAQCPLWISRYGPEPSLPPGWDVWTLWQYTDGVYGPTPRTVDGIGPCDRDTFNGDGAGLRRLWNADALPPIPNPTPWTDIPQGDPDLALFLDARAAVGGTLGYPDGTLRPKEPVTLRRLFHLLKKLGLFPPHAS